MLSVTSPIRIFHRHLSFISLVSSANMNFDFDLTDYNLDTVMTWFENKDFDNLFEYTRHRDNGERQVAHALIC